MPNNAEKHLTAKIDRFLRDIRRDELIDQDLLTQLELYVKAYAQREPERKRRETKLPRSLDWLYSDDGLIQQIERIKNPSGRLIAGRFYTFSYIPRTRMYQEKWDAKPVILCLNPNYQTRYWRHYNKNNKSGMLAINWNYFPLRQRRLFMKKFILENRFNKARFIKNKPLLISDNSIRPIYNNLRNWGALRQYLKPGRYLEYEPVVKDTKIRQIKPEFVKTKLVEPKREIVAGYFNFREIPFQNIIGLLEADSVYEFSGLFSNDLPKGYK